ncbi:helix-turn-helix domain-containing protein [Tropicimonas marinistellae]|uniref:helix-turn-helix domain-containing protein n=1 Tax=Tropicimonas marinistellae TaxID=1739787 RepID=UPI000835C95E|nr:helix-turn-helix transcriptional regulator [Tropicimonas marinistellae]
MVITDKLARADVFRTRLLAQMAANGVNRSALARAVGADRSTIAQMLAEGTARLPNAHLAAECASALGVSSDWLLGLTDRPERPGDVLAAAMTVTEAARSSADAQLHEWHREAAGAKIRHVPATLPDVLKTEQMMSWEYNRALGRTAEQAIGASQDRLTLLGEEMSDYEIAVSIGELRAFAAGEGYYRGLDASVRRAQIDSMIRATSEHFPSLRLYLYDARRVFSAPVSVFGRFLGVVYVGRFYLAFRSRDRVRSLTEHFDGLIREAEIDAREVPGWLETLADEIPRA